MNPNRLLPPSAVCSVRADVTIAECIRILRDKSLGALIIVSDDAREEIVGIFTERDLVKNFELIQRGGFWEVPVRSVMTTALRTIKPNELHEAPRLMARYHIRHLPVVAEEKGKKRVIGVLSMRDIFRLVMEGIDYDLGKALYQAPAPQEDSKKLVGVFSQDAALLQVIDKSAKLSPHCVVKGVKFDDSLHALDDYFKKFQALFVDLDDLSPVQISKLLAQARSVKKKKSLFVAFQPSRLSIETGHLLHALAESEQVGLFSKPLAVGLLYEKFLKIL